MIAAGFRVKSGYAIAVVLTGSPASPQAVARRIVTLSDPDIPETKQPYHDGFYSTEEDASEIARRVKIVTRCAKASMNAFIRETKVTSAGLVVGSVIDPDRVGNPHIRAHAHEGRLFRTVLEDALQSHDVVCRVLLEKELGARASSDLARPSVAIARMLTTFNKTLGSPWRADEKAAATAAWLSLTRS